MKNSMSNANTCASCSGRVRMGAELWVAEEAEVEEVVEMTEGFIVVSPLSLRLRVYVTPRRESPTFDRQSPDARWHRG